MPNKKPIFLDDKLHWYKDAVIYELHIKAFNDSNGDGIGDFEGLIQKLDYLQDLGITAIWVLPFYPSPLRDDGYDIADYYSINPSYGDLKQFKKFLKEAHARSLKVITELVINHSSDQHPWFQRARRAPKGSPERDFYVWSDDPNQWKDVRIIFQDYETSNWTWDPVAQQYYWHRFFHHQPDLNFDNPLVQEEVFRMLDYWCDMGVDGFRLDAVPYLYEREGTNGENLPETHAYLKRLRAHVDEKHPGTLLLAEANMWPEDSASYFGNGDECQMNYHFPVMPRMFMALQMEDRYPITDIFDQTPEIPETCQWGIFLRNHDELTLEMVTDEERDYMYKMYVKDPRARINLGIRHRLAPLMANNRQKIELLNYLLFSLKGTPIIYYGDEIGMGDNFYLGDRDGVRTPMQWSADRNAGFSGANPQKLYLPVILDPEYHYEAVNVELQNRNSSSLLWWMKRLIATRKKHRAFSRGDMQFIQTENPKILAFTRSYEGETMLVVVNLSRFSQPVEMDLSAYKGHQLVEVFSKNKFPAVNSESPYFFTLGPYDCYWFSLSGVSNRNAGDMDSLGNLRVKKWEDLSARAVREQLETDLLPAYLMKTRWFGGKARGMQTVRITDQIDMQVADGIATILLFEVAYQSGLPETYQLPVTFAKKSAADKLKNDCPQSVVACLQLDGEDGVLYDALYCEAFQLALFERMVQQQDLTYRDDTISFSSSKPLQEYGNSGKKVKPKLLGAEQSNTSLTFDNKFFLKIYRKVEAAVNPDLELTRFFAKGDRFPYTPAYLGAIEWQQKSSAPPTVLGMMQSLVENSGDGWSYMLERLRLFNDQVLSQEKPLPLPPLKGSLIAPLGYDEIPEPIRSLLEPTAAENARLLGERTAGMHLALQSDGGHTDFTPEPFSLHYQRSLFSSFQTLVRSTFQAAGRNLKRLPKELQRDVEEVTGMRDAILGEMKKIYSHKLDAVKTRIHGDYHLGQTLFTGKDFVILDFEGEPSKSYSERRLKRSPLRDVAGMVRSFHYAAYGGLFLNSGIRKEDVQKLTPYAEQWAHYMAGFFMKAYLETMSGSASIPLQKEDLDLMLRTFILEKAIYELNYELNNRPDWVIIPLRGILSLMKGGDVKKQTRKDAMA